VHWLSWVPSSGIFQAFFTVSCLFISLRSVFLLPNFRHKIYIHPSWFL
jgi:hypothetical protein